MADTNLFTTNELGSFVGTNAAIAKVTGVNDGGTVAISGVWTILPAEEPYKFKRLMKTETYTLRDGSEIIRKTLTGAEYASMFAQRSAAALELDLTFAGSECVLISKGHYLSLLGTPKQGWLFMFGTTIPHDSDIDSQTGKIPFLFRGRPNTQAVTLNYTTTASAKVDHPVLAALTPTADITIAAFNGAAMTGVYKIVDL